MKTRGWVAAVLAGVLLVVAGAGPTRAADGPVLTSTGLVDGQLFGNQTVIAAVYSDDVVQVETLVNGQYSRMYTRLNFAVHAFVPAAWHDTDVTVTVRVFDAAGAVAEASTRVRADVVLPVFTFDPPARTTVRGPTTITVTPSTGDTALVQLMEIEDGVRTEVGRRTEAPYVFTYDLTGKQGNLWIHVTDGAGNLARGSGAYTVFLDVAPPVVTAMTPARDALLRGNTVTTTVTAFDPSGISDARLGAQAGTPISSGVWSSTAPLGADGPLTLMWTLRDAAGNVTTYARPYRVDNTLPKITNVTAPANGAKVSGTVKTTATATDLNGIAKIELRVNDITVLTDTTSPYNLNLNTAPYGKSFTVNWVAFDKAGNKVSTSRRTWKK